MATPIDAFTNTLNAEGPGVIPAGLDDAIADAGAAAAFVFDPNDPNDYYVPAALTPGFLRLNGSETKIKKKINDAYDVAMLAIDDDATIDDANKIAVKQDFYTRAKPIVFDYIRAAYIPAAPAAAVPAAAVPAAAAPAPAPTEYIDSKFQKNDNIYVMKAYDPVGVAPAAGAAVVAGMYPVCVIVYKDISKHVAPEPAADAADKVDFIAALSTKPLLYHVSKFDAANMINDMARDNIAFGGAGRKSNKRKSNKRKSNKRKSNKNKLNKRKSNKRKSI